VTYLEHAFPFVKVSRLVEADRRAPDPAYQAHRWSRIERGKRSAA